MAITITDFLRLRPFVFHITARENVSFLRSTRALFTTLSLLESAGRTDLAGLRRTSYVTLQLTAGQVTPKDQKPLVEVNAELPADWSFADFVQYLNGFTYFWPGSEEKPIGSGRRLLGHYENEGPLVLRIPTVDLFNANETLEPLFSAVNSGAPRYHSGRKARRGPDLFSSSSQFSRNARDVVELAFRGNTVLPGSTSFRTAEGWRDFFPTAL